MPSWGVPRPIDDIYTGSKAAQRGASLLTLDIVWRCLGDAGATPTRSTQLQVRGVVMTSRTRPNLLVSGPAGGGKSALLREMLASGQIDVAADFTAIHNALKSRRSACADGTFPVRDEFDILLQLAEATRHCHHNRGRSERV